MCSSALHSPSQFVVLEGSDVATCLKAWCLIHYDDRLQIEEQQPVAVTPVPTHLFCKTQEIFSSLDSCLMACTKNSSVCFPTRLGSSLMIFMACPIGQRALMLF